MEDELICAIFDIAGFEPPKPPKGDKFEAKTQCCGLMRKCKKGKCKPEYVLGGRGKCFTCHWIFEMRSEPKPFPISSAEMVEAHKP